MQALVSLAQTVLSRSLEKKALQSGKENSHMEYMLITVKIITEVLTKEF